MNGKKRKKKQISFFLAFVLHLFVIHVKRENFFFLFSLSIHELFLYYTHDTIIKQNEKKMNVYCLKLGGFGIGYRREGIGDERKLYINIDSFVLHYYHQTI